MGDDIDDLIGFLADRRVEVKLVSLDIIKGLTGSPEGIEKLKTKLEKLLIFMLRLVPVQEPDEPSIKVSEHACMSLVNLSNDSEVAAKMLSMKVIGRVMDYIREGACPHHRLMAMILCNLTVTVGGCEDILQLGQERLEGLHMAVLLKKFVSSGITWSGEEGKEDPYEHVAAVLTNVTRLAKGRALLLQPGRGLLQALVAQLRSPGEMRRRGAAGAIKNLCMATEEDNTIDKIVADDLLLTRMLEPINGLEPKEKDAIVREAMAESLLALASCKEGRIALWKINGPEILRKGYELEEDRKVCRAMEMAADQFLGNQGECEEAVMPAAAAADPAGTNTAAVEGGGSSSGSGPVGGSGGMMKTGWM